MNKYEKITREEIEKAINDFYKENPNKKHNFPFVKKLGEGVYQIGGAITGDGGLKMFEKAMKEHIEKDLENKMLWNNIQDNDFSELEKAYNELFAYAAKINEPELSTLTLCVGGAMNRLYMKLNYKNGTK
jgi:hypothetical protein